MNIFVLNEDTQACARAHVDAHVVKMILESVQMLCTAKRVSDGILYHDKTSNGRSIKRWLLQDDILETTLYKATHINHPCNVWLRESSENYWWLWSLAHDLSEEYTHRFGKVHKSSLLLPLLHDNPPCLKLKPRTPFSLAMPAKYKEPGDPIQSYRNYYALDKAHLMKYTGRERPHWLKV